MDLTGICSYILLGIFWVTHAKDNEWSYDGTHGPENWVKTFGICGRNRQSPINFPGETKMQYDSSLRPFRIIGLDNANNYQLKLRNNGHTAVVSIMGDVFVEGGSLPDRFQMAQFHFHWGKDDSQGSEHLYDGEPFPMELHIVTYNTKYQNISFAQSMERDGLAVLGFWFKSSGNVDNPLLTPLINKLSSVVDADDHGSTIVSGLNLNDVIKGNLDRYYRYSGSLTTPPCYESVIWSVFQRRIEVSNAQLNAFRRLHESEDANGRAEALVDNFRPAQYINGRQVSRSFQSGVPVLSSSITVAVLSFIANRIIPGGL